MTQYGPIAVLAQLSVVILVNISSTGTVRKKFGVGKWKKIGVLAIQKAAKTGNIGNKNQWQAISICKIPQHAEG